MVVLGIHTRTSAIVHCQWSRSFASEHSCLLYTLTPALSVCVCMLKYSIMSLEMYVCVRECQVHCGLYVYGSDCISSARYMHLHGSEHRNFYLIMWANGMGNPSNYPHKE